MSIRIVMINLIGVGEVLFLNRCEIQWKRFKHGVNVIVDV